MNTTSKRTIGMATLLGNRGFTCVAVEVHTPDGRTWNVGSMPDGGFVLFELHLGNDRQPTEHDCPNGRWGKADLLDYLEAITK